MLHTTNLVLLVGQSDYGDFSPRKITMWNTLNNTVLCTSWPFVGKISLAKMNKKRLIITERNYMHIYNTDEMKVIHSIVIGNIGVGKLVLSPNSDKNNYVIYSCNEDEGIAKIYDMLYLSFKNSIKAHKTAILRMALNIRGDMLTTCSNKGTIIRIFSIPKGEKLFSFKRGMTSAYILSMNFSSDSEKLIASSDTGTMHVFDLKQEEDTSNKENTRLGSYVVNLFNNVTSKIIPKDYEDYVGNFKILKYKNYLIFLFKSNKQI